MRIIVLLQSCASSACVLSEILDGLVGGRVVMLSADAHSALAQVTHACRMAAYKARLSPPAPRKIAEPRDVGHIAPQPASEPAHTLLSISADAREAVLSQLNAADLCQCQLVCKALREEACSDSLWRRLCNCQWAGTHAGAWLSTSRSNPGPEDSRMSGPYTNYRQLYPALLRYDSVVGVWRAPAGNLTSLFRFRWARDCIEGSRLTYTVGPGGPKTSLSVDIGGSGSNAQIEDLTTDECTLAIPPPAPLHRSPSQGAQAAAAVAANRVRLIWMGKFMRQKMLAVAPSTFHHQLACALIAGCRCCSVWDQSKGQLQSRDCTLDGCES